jgi:hypothetical protein
MSNKGFKGARGQGVEVRKQEYIGKSIMRRFSTFLRRQDNEQKLKIIKKFTAADCPSWPQD